MKALAFATLIALAITPTPLLAQSSACLQSDGSSLPRESCTTDTGTTGSIIDQSGTNDLNGNSPIAQQPLPKGMDPIRVPSLGRQNNGTTGTTQITPTVPLNGNSSIGGSGGVSSQPIR